MEDIVDTNQVEFAIHERQRTGSEKEGDRENGER